MSIEATVRNLFLKIANKLGLELIQKTDGNIYYVESGLNPTAIGARVIANIAIDDSDIIIEGDSDRANSLRNIKEYYTDEIQTVAAEVSLGTGDAIVRPYTDGKYIGLNVIGNDNFVVTECIGTHLKGIIMMVDEVIQENNKVYRLFESQTLKENDNETVVYIKRFAYCNNKEISLIGTSWESIPADEIITANQLLIGRYKCPTINRDNYNSANGVPITFGCEEIIDTIKEKYEQYNDEFDRKLAKTFADKTMFKSEKSFTGAEERTIKGHQFVLTKGGMNNGVSDMIQDYSPAIRETEFQAANNFNLSVLELCCGFSRGVFTSPETAFATATEMKNSLKKTFSFVKHFRRRLESGDRMLFNAINIIMNINGTSPVGDWNIRHDWSYDYIEETKERFNQLVQGHNAGVVKDETLCAWVNNLDEDEAKIYMAELKANAPADIIEPANNDDGIV